MRIPGFYRLTIDERLGEVAREYGLTDEEATALKQGDRFTVEAADKMVENMKVAASIAHQDLFKHLPSALLPRRAAAVARLAALVRA